MPGATKTILVICGTGIATSTLVVSKLQAFLNAHPELPPTRIRQGKVMDVISGAGDADVIVATTQVPATVNVPVISGLPLLTGMGTDAVYQQLTEALQNGS